MATLGTYYGNHGKQRVFYKEIDGQPGPTSTNEQVFYKDPGLTKPLTTEEQQKIDALARTQIAWHKAIDKDSLEIIISANKGSIPPRFINNLLESLKKNNIIDEKLVEQLLSNIARGVGEYTKYAYLFLPGILEAGITDPEIIVRLLTDIDQATGEDTYFAYKALPGAIETIQEVGITDPETIARRLSDMAQAIGEYTYSAYEALPGILEAGITDLETIIQLLSRYHSGGWKTSSSGL